MFKVDTKEPAELFFEDFTEGQQMPVVTKGPMSAGHQVRWAWRLRQLRVRVPPRQRTWRRHRACRACCCPARSWRATC